MSKSAISELASPFNDRALGSLRNRKYNEDPQNNKLSASGDKDVWFKINKSDAAIIGGPERLVAAIERCFNHEGLNPECHVLQGADSDSRHTLSFTFPAEHNEAVNKEVKKIVEASRRHQQSSEQGAVLAK